MKVKVNVTEVITRLCEVDVNINDDATPRKIEGMVYKLLSNSPYELSVLDDGTDEDFVLLGKESSYSVTALTADAFNVQLQSIKDCMDEHTMIRCKNCGNHVVYGPILCNDCR